jgi:hypothetical protein
MMHSHTTLALFTPSPLPDGFIPAPVCLSEVSFGSQRYFVVTLGRSVLGRRGRWEFQPRTPEAAWVKDHCWIGIREAKIRADIAIKAYKLAIQEISDGHKNAA